MSSRPSPPPYRTRPPHHSAREPTQSTSSHSSRPSGSKHSAHKHAHGASSSHSARVSDDDIQRFIEYLKNKGTKSKASISEEDRVAEDIKNIGSRITKYFGPFMDLGGIFYAGLHPDDEDNDQADIDIFNRLMALYPTPRGYLSDCENDKKTYKLLIHTLERQRQHARSADTNLAKFAMGREWLAFDPIYHPIGLPEEKSDRGWHHIECARALTPFERKEEFIADPQQFCNNVLNGTIVVTANSFPSFLYPHDAVYRAGEEETGLFRGHTLIRVCSAWTVHWEVLQSYWASNMHEVFPEAVAYAAVQAHFALSYLSSWSYVTNGTGDFNYMKFFRNCVALLEDKEDPWVKETMQFLNSQMPSLKRKRERGSSGREDQGVDEVGEILRRRALNKKRKVELKEEGGVEGVEEKESLVAEDIENKAPVAARFTTSMRSRPKSKHRRRR